MEYLSFQQSALNLQHLAKTYIVCFGDFKDRMIPLIHPYIEPLAAGQGFNNKEGVRGLRLRSERRRFPLSAIHS